MVTAGTSVEVGDDRTLQTFLPSAGINNESKWELYNLVCMHNTIQGQFVPSGFAMRALATLP